MFVMKNIIKKSNLINTFSKRISIKSFTKNLFIQHFFFLKSSSSFHFCTSNNVDEKHSLEFIEAGIFEVLKGTSKCKTNKLSRSATMDDLG